MTTLEDIGLSTLDDLDTYEVNAYNTALIPTNANAVVMLSHNAHQLATELSRYLTKLSTAGTPTYKIRPKSRTDYLLIASAAIFFAALGAITTIFIYSALLYHTGYNTFFAALFSTITILIVLYILVNIIQDTMVVKLNDPRKTILTTEIPDCKLLLNNENDVSFSLQADAAEGIDPDALELILKYEPADNDYRATVISLIIDLLLNEQIEELPTKNNQLSTLNNLYEEIIVQKRDHFIQRFPQLVPFDAKTQNIVNLTNEDIFNAATNSVES